MRLALLLTSILALSGCGKLLGPKGPQPVKAYPDGATGLQAMFKDVLDLAKADDRERVHDYFSSLKMTPAELQALFGPQANELQRPYDDMMATLMHRGAVELVATIYEKKYDTVEVQPMALPAAEDAALQHALVSHPTLYSVRFKKNGESLGTRYDFMFYSEGHWRTGNQLAKLLARRAAELTTAPPTR